MNIHLSRICSVPIRISSQELHIPDTFFLQKLHFMEQYVTTTYRSHDLPLFVQDGYVTTTHI